MKSPEIINILKDLFDEYGGHTNLTRSEKHQVEMWLEGMYAVCKQIEGRRK